MKPELRPEPAPCTAPPCSRAFKLILEFAKSRGIRLPLPEEVGEDGKRKAELG